MHRSCCAPPCSLSSGQALGCHWNSLSFLVESSRICCLEDCQRSTQRGNHLAEFSLRDWSCLCLHDSLQPPEYFSPLGAHQCICPLDSRQISLISIKSVSSLLMPFLLFLVISCSACHSQIVVCKEERSQPAAIEWYWSSWWRSSCLFSIDWLGWLCWSCPGTPWSLWWWRCRVSILVLDSIFWWRASYE